jgi:hypothetical protein
MGEPLVVVDVARRLGVPLAPPLASKGLPMVPVRGVPAPPAETAETWGGGPGWDVIFT